MRAVGHCSNDESTPMLRLLDHVWRASPDTSTLTKCIACATKTEVVRYKTMILTSASGERIHPRNLTPGGSPAIEAPQRFWAHRRQPSSNQKPKVLFRPLSFFSYRTARGPTGALSGVSVPPEVPAPRPAARSAAACSSGERATHSAAFYGGGEVWPEVAPPLRWADFDGMLCALHLVPVTRGGVRMQGPHIGQTISDPSA